MCCLIGPGPSRGLDHLALSPATATVAAGTAKALNAVGSDLFGNSLGEVTAVAAVFIADSPPTSAPTGTAYSYTFAVSGNPTPRVASACLGQWTSRRPSGGAGG